MSEQERPPLESSLLLTGAGPGSGGPAGPGGPLDALLLEDGTSGLLLEDGASYLLLE